MAGRVIAMGDIHGCLTALAAVAGYRCYHRDAASFAEMATC
jgi:hypothetical protein